MMLQWRRLRPGHYIALTPTQTFEAARQPNCWVLIGRDWPGDSHETASIYETWGLGHFATLRECKEKTQQFVTQNATGIR